LVVVVVLFYIVCVCVCVSLSLSPHVPPGPSRSSVDADVPSRQFDRAAHHASSGLAVHQHICSPLCGVSWTCACVVRLLQFPQCCIRSFSVQSTSYVHMHSLKVGSASERGACTCNWMRLLPSSPCAPPPRLLCCDSLHWRTHRVALSCCCSFFFWCVRLCTLAVDPRCCWWRCCWQAR
jgi:hypothetical protein